MVNGQKNTMENGSVPLKNNLIQQKSEMFIIISPKFPVKAFGQEQFFFVELNSPQRLN